MHYSLIGKTQLNSCELLEYWTIFDCANDALKTWTSDSLTVTSLVSRGGPRTSPIRLHAIWLGFVKQHKEEHCSTTKSLDDKTPIVLGALCSIKSKWMSPSQFQKLKTLLYNGENLSGSFELVFDQVTTADSFDVD